LVDFLEQLRRSNSCSSISLWEASGAAEIDSEEDSPLPERFSRILENLQRMRFPRLSSYEESFRQLRSSIGLPQSIKLTVPDYFEGNRISLSMTAENPQEIFKLGTKLIEISGKKELEKIFELL
jgi:hypothetical protein